ncbi:MAG: (4Fe-4S)-binding protein [Eggerthellaceae bacterium]|nr:(4Fe-4S)-binding protein [Eggerthellaceae bacterium]
MSDYRITHDPHLCVKCGLCAAFCPIPGILEMGEDGYPRVISADACVGCQTCSGNCPKRALAVEVTGDAVFDPYEGEELAESISKERQAEFAELQESIMDSLDLRWQPVAVSLIRQDELLPDAPIPSENLRFCQAMMAARRGASILMPPHRHSCPDGTSIFGMTGVPEKLATGEIYVLFHKVVDAEAAARMVAERPTLPEKSRRATYVAPLAKTVREPEVVVFSGTPEQMMWLCMSMSYYDGHRFDFHASGFNSMCVEAVLLPLDSDEPNITFGCYGCRAATDVDENIMFMGVPLNRLETIAKGAAELAKKAIPDSRNKIYVPPIM